MEEEEVPEVVREKVEETLEKRSQAEDVDSETEDEPERKTSWLSQLVRIGRRVGRRIFPKRIRLSPFESAVRGSFLLRRVRRDFLKFDTDGSGTIERSELCKVIGLDRRSFWLRALLDYFDTDSDGRISFEEFVGTLGILGAQASSHRKSRETENIRPNVLFLFALVDYDGNGVLDRSEFSSILWEYEKSKERQFGKIKSIKMKNSSIDAALDRHIQEAYIADRRAYRREFLRPVRNLVKGAILYLTRQCSTELSLQDFNRVYQEFPELFEVPDRVYKKKIKVLAPRCTKLIRKLNKDNVQFDKLQAKVIEAAIRNRVERERAKGKWQWARKLALDEDRPILPKDDRPDEQSTIEIAQIDRLLRGDGAMTKKSAEEHEFLSSFSFRRDGSFRRMESRRRRGPRASGRGESSLETIKMRTRQISREPPHEAALVLAELGVTAQKEVIRRLKPDVAASIIAEMQQLEQDILLAHFKEMKAPVMALKKEKDRRLVGTINNM